MNVIDFIGKYNHATIGLFNGGVPPLIPKGTMQQLVQDIADTFAVTLDTSVNQYNDITELLANTDLAVRGFAYVVDATDDPAVAEGWALYLMTVSAPSDLASYNLIAKEFVSSGSGPAPSIMIDWAYDATGDVYPTVGNGAGGAVRQNNQYCVVTPGTELMPIGAILTAKIHNPGSTRANWHISQGGE